MPTDHELVRWFSREPLNLAVVTGQVSQVVVVDADTPEALVDDVGRYLADRSLDRDGRRWRRV